MLIERIKPYRIILASASPRRRELLGSLGIDFELSDGCKVDESYPPDLSGKDIPLFLALKKSEAYPGSLGSMDILITADTIVFQDGKVLLKPDSESAAHQTLRSISGRSHFVFTGVCLRSAIKTASFVASTEVIFDNITDEEIDHYIKSYKPFDKAGSYGIQEWIGYVGVEEIRGSYFNVMGLPVHKLYRELDSFIK